MAQADTAQLVAEAQRLLERSPTDAQVVLEACEALIAAAERTPADEPGRGEAPARSVVQAAERCRAALSSTELARYGVALEASRANALRLLRDYEGALSAFEALLREDPERGASWFDHEFGSSVLGAGTVGWDWFGLRLDDGRELMLFVLRDASGKPQPASAATLVERDGATRALGREDFTLTSTSTWTSPKTGTRWARASCGALPAKSSARPSSHAGCPGSRSRPWVR